MPTVHGEDSVLRVLDKESMSEKFAKLTLDVVGFYLTGTGSVNTAYVATGTFDTAQPFPDPQAIGNATSSAEIGEFAITCDEGDIATSGSIQQVAFNGADSVLPVPVLNDSGNAATWGVVLASDGTPIGVDNNHAINAGWNVNPSGGYYFVSHFWYVATVSCLDNAPAHV